MNEKLTTLETYKLYVAATGNKQAAAMLVLCDIILMFAPDDVPDEADEIKDEVTDEVTDEVEA